MMRKGFQRLSQARSNSDQNLLHVEVPASANDMLTWVTATGFPGPGCFHGKPFASCIMKGFSSSQGMSGVI